MTGPLGNTWDALDCRVYIDGVRVVDGSESTDTDADVTALAGLTVSWGRASTVEQPPPAVCNFQLMDLDGSRAFLETCRVGRLVDVEASGLVYTGNLTTVADPTFSRYPTGLNLSAHLSLSQRPVVDLDHYYPDDGPWVNAAPVRKVAGGGISIGPREFDETGGAPVPHRSDRIRLLIPPRSLPDSLDPGGWDAFPTTIQGQPWTATATITLPIGASATLQVVGVRRPADYRQDSLAMLTPPQLVPAGAANMTISFVANESGVWPALVLNINPTAVTYNAWANGVRYVDVTPSTLTYNQLASAGLSTYQISSPSTENLRTVRVFSGRITDAIAKPYMGGVGISVTAVDTLGQLASMVVGTQPLPRQPISTRIPAFMAAAGYPGQVSIDVSAQPLEVGAIDVDRQAALNLLQDIASGLDLVLWGATHRTTGPYISLEDPRNRTPTLKLAMGTGGLVEIQPAAPRADVTRINACDLVQDPIEWRQDVADVATRVAVQWQDQTQTPPAGVTLTQINTDLEPGGPYGVRSVSLTSQTTSSTEAARIAGQLLKRLAFTGWRMSGAVWDLADISEINPDSLNRALTLLDGTARIGRAIQLVDLPEWSPTIGPQSAYLEGGNYAYTGDGWVLALNLSAAQGIGPSVTYGDVAFAGPTWRYIDVSPTISYNDLIGVYR